MILLALSTPSIHACGVDDGPRYLAPVPRPVLSVGRFSQALLGHSCKAPKSYTFGYTSRTVPDLRNPGNRITDLSFFKNNYFGPEGRVNLQYRLEMFGALNTPQFGAPGNTLGTGSFGVISNSGGSRQIQMALK